MTIEIKQFQLTANGKKGAVALLLGLVLLAIVFLQQGKSGAPSFSSPTTDRSGYPPSASTATSTAPTSPTSTALLSNTPISMAPTQVAPGGLTELPPMTLPTVDLSKLLSSDPFRCRQEHGERSLANLVPGAGGFETNKKEHAIEKLEQDPPIELSVNGIIIGNGGATALIGKDLYRENDLIEGGWQIVAIKKNSILVSRPVTKEQN